MSTPTTPPTANTTPSLAAAPLTSAAGDKTAAGGGSGKKKKKKRSALANASNPHHLRNYVPSRLPNQGVMNSAHSIANQQNLLSPLPIRFLTAEPRKGRGELHDRASANGGAGGPVIVNPADEWICPTCEYRLFYGDEHGYRIAIRNRKKILKRRRRARERAAAAASGKLKPTTAAAAAPPVTAPASVAEDNEDDADEEFGEEDWAAESGPDVGSGGRRRPGRARIKDVAVGT
jgi:hypothetical protein